MPPSKFEANPTLRLRVNRSSFSLFPLASSCLNAYFHAYAIIDFLADQLVFLKTVTYILYFCIYLFFLSGRPKFAGNDHSSEKMVKRSFQHY